MPVYLFPKGTPVTYADTTACTHTEQEVLIPSSRVLRAFPRAGSLLGQSVVFSAWDGSPFGPEGYRPYSVQLKLSHTSATRRSFHDQTRISRLLQHREDRFGSLPLSFQCWFRWPLAPMVQFGHYQLSRWVYIQSPGSIILPTPRAPRYTSCLSCRLCRPHKPADRVVYTAGQCSRGAFFAAEAGCSAGRDQQSLPITYPDFKDRGFQDQENHSSTGVISGLSLIDGAKEDQTPQSILNLNSPVGQKHHGTPT